MRLYLLPISNRQYLLYCQRLTSNSATTGKPASFADRITKKATNTWVEWERRESGWQKKVTDYGNTLFQRLPYQEYGLKSVPPLTQAGKDAWLKKLSGLPEAEATTETANHNEQSHTSGRGNAYVDNTEDEHTVELRYPEGMFERPKVWEAIRTQGSNATQGFHSKWLLASLVGMPITAPFALVPM